MWGFEGCGFFLFTAALRLARRSCELGMARRRRLFIIKALQGATPYPGVEDTLDAANHILIFRGNKSEGLTGLSIAASVQRLC